MKYRFLVPAFILALTTIGSLSLFGLPRYSARVEQKCNLCHVSPTGGGMRNGFGSQYFALTELAVHKTPLDEIGGFQPNISEILSLGMDMRTQYIYDESAELSSFFQMEGNFYLNAQLDRRYSVTLKKGLYDGFEVFGMGYVLPMQGYFRVGKFQPSFGWRFADHTSFVRERMLWPPTSVDTGLEVGFYPQGISANFGLFNGSGGVFDDGKGKALSSRLELRHNVGGFGFGVGGSYYFADGSAGDRTMYGPFYYANVGKLIYLGEIDWLESEVVDPAGITSMATTQKLTYMVRQGIWFELLYDFHDPDVDTTSGTVSRYGAAIDYLPFGFLELEPMIRYYDDDTFSDEKYILFNTQFHFFF